MILEVSKIISQKMGVLNRYVISQVNRNWRAYSSTSKAALGVMYEEYGDPRKVLKLTDLAVPEKDMLTPPLGMVSLKVLAAPVNPADINMVQGTYPVKPQIPAVGGNEGVAEVTAVGSDVENFKIGDWVVPSASGWGTWKTRTVSCQSEVKKIANDIPLISAATLAVNPATAYRMLRDFVKLRPGDVIIQNGANSAVGQSVIQIAKEMEVKTVNIIRDRQEIGDLKNYLKKIGATEVVTEEFVRKPEMKELLKSLGDPPKLAFNCVGGKSATELLRQLDHKGHMVTYGGMSKQPVTIPTGLLIFKNIKLHGYWMTQWNIDNQDSLEMRNMLNDLSDMARFCKLMPPHANLIPFKDFEVAIEQAMKPLTTKKQILVMDDEFLDE